MNELSNLKNEFGDRFSTVFKSITCDNGLEFSELASIEEDYNTKIYFTHPYTSCERGTNERHNGLLRRFIPKGIAMNNFTVDEIAFVEDWYNTLPRKILGYKAPIDLFEDELDVIYTI